MKLCINSRDELKLIDLKEVCYMKACGNYTDFYFVDAKTRSETGCLSFFAKQIENLYSSNNPFIRIGRSYIINSEYISLINIPQKTVQIKMAGTSNITLPKKLLKELRDILLAKHQNGALNQEDTHFE